MFKNNKPISEKPAWQYESGIMPGTWHEFSVTARDKTFHIHSLPGIFSYNHLDRGTKLLLDTLDIQHGASVIDLGCGFGVIGLTVAEIGAGQVIFVDNNLWATAAAQKNIEANNFDNCTVIKSDVLEMVSAREVDFVISNPPFHTGKSVDYLVTEAFIEQSKRVLRKSGRLVLVANKFIRYQDIIDSHFSSTKIAAETNRYHVLIGRK